MITIHVDASGPIPDGESGRIVEDYLEEAVWDVGQQGFAGVHTILNERIRNPTPYYETQITMERGGEAAAGFESDVTPVAVHDRGVIYGWWLEGIGSKNAPVTSFRGYRAFGTTAVALNKGVAVQIAQSTLQRYLPRLRGGG